MRTIKKIIKSPCADTCSFGFLVSCLSLAIFRFFDSRALQKPGTSMAYHQHPILLCLFFLLLLGFFFSLTSFPFSLSLFPFFFSFPRIHTWQQDRWRKGRDQHKNEKTNVAYVLHRFLETRIVYDHKIVAEEALVSIDLKAIISAELFLLLDQLNAGYSPISTSTWSRLLARKQGWHPFQIPRNDKLQHDASARL